MTVRKQTSSPVKSNNFNFNDQYFVINDQGKILLIKFRLIENQMNSTSPAPAAAAAAPVVITNIQLN